VKKFFPGFACPCVIILLLLLAALAPPAVAEIRVVDSLVHERTSSPGASYTGSILVENTGETPCTIRVYQTDYLYSAEGKNIYGTPGVNPSSNAKWITLSSNWLTIPAKETARVNYEVRIPPNHALKGTYWSMVMVEDADGQPVTAREDKNAFTLQAKIRYGVQILTNIGNTGTRQIRFLDRKITDHSGQKTLELDIENSGERVLFPLVSVQIYNAGGELIGNFHGRKTRILPTCSVRQKITLPNLLKGNYKALVIVDNGDQFVFGANYDLLIK
jgi:hypothetical protein